MSILHGLLPWQPKKVCPAQLKVGQTKPEISGEFLPSRGISLISMNLPIVPASCERVL